jgi:hypothetical protein
MFCCSEAVWTGSVYIKFKGTGVSFSVLCAWGARVSRVVCYVRGVGRLCVSVKRGGGRGGVGQGCAGFLYIYTHTVSYIFEKIRDRGRIQCRDVSYAALMQT